MIRSAEKETNQRNGNKTRARKWVRWLGWFGAIAALLLFSGWRAAIWYTERASPFSGTPLPRCGQAILDERYAQAIGKARDQIQAMMAERQIPGVSVAIAVDGKIVWSEGFGFADVEKKILACPETQFRIASVSKVLTAAAMTKLSEEGRLDLDGPIQRYVPSFPDKGYKITARQLASHRAGIRHYRDDSESINKKYYTSATESLEKFKDDPLVFPPGSDFMYSSYGYVLLSAAIEGASGENFLSYMDRSVFKSLGMMNTAGEQVNQPTRQQSTFYDSEAPYSPDGKIVISP